MFSSEVTDRHQETIDWDVEELKAATNCKADAKYGALSESLRHSIPENKVCSLFCGGRKCKYCTPERWNEDQQAIKGLFSSWVTDNIVASARPSTTLIEKYNIIDQFQKAGIRSIINLQLPEEHASCGYGLESEGFSYVPQHFMENGVFFYNFGWQDYGVGSLANILDMVKVMQFAVSEGKVLIHCHAGCGRTGVLIACYLIFVNRMNPNEAIHYVRSKRPGAVQTRNQVLCINEFDQYFKPMTVVFSSLHGETHDFTLTQYLTRQKHILHGYEARKLKFIPKLIYVCSERLLQLAHKKAHPLGGKDSIDMIRKSVPSAFNNKHPTHSGTNLTTSTSSSNLLDPGTSSFSRLKSNSMTSFPVEASPDSDRDTESKSDVSPSRSSSSCTGSTEEVAGGLDAGLEAGENFAEDIAHCMALTEYPAEVLEKLKSYKIALNEDSMACLKLSMEDDAVLLSAIIWDWLDHLKEPVLHSQDMPHVLDHTDDPMTGLARLDKGTRATVEYMLKVMARLLPLSEQTELLLIQRMLSTLTHQNIVTEISEMMTSKKPMVRRTSNDSGIMKAAVTNKLLFFFAHLLHLLCQKEQQKNQQALQTEQTKPSTSFAV